MRRASSDLNDVLEGLRGQVQSLDAMTRNILDHQEANWQAIPPELLAAAAQDNVHKGRPTSKKALEQIPRIVLDDNCTLFRQATLQVIMTTTAASDNSNNNPSDKTDPTVLLRVSAMVGEFGPVGEHHYQGASLVVASPLTGKGGLSEETIQKIHNVHWTSHLKDGGGGGDDKQQKKKNKKNQVILYLQRGDGLTFVQKALLAQKAGACAVIIGNNTSFPWPYVMKDSKQEAETHGLKIPVVMVKEEDGKQIVKQQRQHEHSKQTVLTSIPTTPLCCNLHITSQSKDCVVCCEKLQNTETVIQLPGCAHIFHEACAMVWLKANNTCPYCRRELPTDDEDYERERRRQQRTHAGSGGASGSGNNANEWSGYYG
ncbi:MAG: hypothetical protein SGILL_007248 [Bacillariaceae sp.]